jgi:Domain of unknown function (DUF1854)
MKYLDVSKLVFRRTAGGLLSLDVEQDEAYPDISCVQLFPLSHPLRYVSMCERCGDGMREIGVIRDCADLAQPQRDLVFAHLRLSYFVPEITDILRISGRRGIDTWEVETDRGNTTFTVQDRKESVSLTDLGVVFVVAVDKCRYKITRPGSLPPRARALLDKNLL